MKMKADVDKINFDLYNDNTSLKLDDTNGTLSSGRELEGLV